MRPRSSHVKSVLLLTDICLYEFYFTIQNPIYNYFLVFVNILILKLKPFFKISNPSD